MENLVLADGCLLLGKVLAVVEFKNVKLRSINFKLQLLTNVLYKITELPALVYFKLCLIY